MSRIFIQNLPKNISESDLKKRFELKGEITDIKVNKSKRHAIIGYKQKSDANEAIDYFNKTFINSNKISVYLSDNSVNSLNKFSKNNKEIEKREENESKEKIKRSKEKYKNRLKEELSALKADPEFDQFIKLQRNVNSGKGKHIWSNDMDMDVNEEPQLIDESDDKIEVKSENEVKIVDKKYEKRGKKRNTKVMPKEIHELTIKLKGLPYKVKKRQIKEFLDPLKPLSLRQPPKVKGIAYVSFRTDTELTQAMVKHRGFLDGHRIEITRCEVNKQNKQQTSETSVESEAKEPKWRSAEPAEESVGESGRIYIRNLSYTCGEKQLRELFERYGPLSEFHLPIDSYTKKLKGFAFVTFVFPEHAVKAVAELDKTDFEGRLLHLIAAKPKPEDIVPPFAANDSQSSFKKSKEQEKKSEAQSSHQWNTLFIGANAIADIMAKRFNIKKSELLADSNANDSIAVRMALGETQIVNEMRRFLLENGVHLKAFNEPDCQRSKNVILVKNLPTNTRAEEIRALFEKYGLVLRVILPPNGVTAVVEMQESVEAKTAFNKLAYNNFKHFPLYLEWAPEQVFRDKSDTKEVIDEEIKELMALENKDLVKHKTIETNENKEELNLDLEPEEDSTLFVKNLNFDTNEEDLRNHFSKCGQIYSANIAYRKDSNQLLSMGYGFIQFLWNKSAQKALKEMQHSVLDGHSLELKISNRTTKSQQKANSGTKVNDIQTGTKICVKNIPFEATVKDVKKLFSVFGELKAVRLPKKLAQIGSYRGFGFIDFVTKNDAKRAFDALCHSTHLYGRPLVLEWAKDTSDETSDTEAKRVAAKTAQNFQKGPPMKRLKKSDIVNDLQSKTSIPTLRTNSFQSKN